jgi:hypothetical protein
MTWVYGMTIVKDRKIIVDKPKVVDVRRPLVAY